MCSKLIQKYHHKFNTILYCGVNSHNLQNNPVINQKLVISSEIANPFDYSYNRNTLFILDNCFLEAIESKFVVNAFTKGRHENISTIFITQNLFFSCKFARSIALNCSRYILMRNRGLGQIEVLGKQLYGKSKASVFGDVYKKALTVNTYGYLLIDLGLKTPPELQLRNTLSNGISMVDKIDILFNLYQDAKKPNSYGSIHRLLQNAKNILPSINLNVIHFLKAQKAYTLHRVTNKFFLRRRVLAPKPGIIASCDLADISSLTRYNNGYKYILVFVDVFSRFAQTIPLKRKDANSVHNALYRIINSSHFNNLKRLNTDEGREFYNAKVKRLLSLKVLCYTAYLPGK